MVGCNITSLQSENEKMKKMKNLIRLGYSILGWHFFDTEIYMENIDSQAIHSTYKSTNLKSIFEMVGCNITSLQSENEKMKKMKNLIRLGYSILGWHFFDTEIYMENIDS
jgi:hemerythrin